MPITDKIKSLISIKGKKNIDVAEYLNLTPQSFNNKLTRGSFSADDLIKIAEFLNCTLEFKVDEKQSIVLDKNDIRNL